MRRVLPAIAPRFPLADGAAAHSVDAAAVGAILPRSWRVDGAVGSASGLRPSRGVVSVLRGRQSRVNAERRPHAVSTRRARRRGPGGFEPEGAAAGQCVYQYPL